MIPIACSDGLDMTMPGAVVDVDRKGKALGLA
jgi:hypothetical protein